MRVGSNPTSRSIMVSIFPIKNIVVPGGYICSYSVVVITMDFESINPSSNLGKSLCNSNVAQRQSVGPITQRSVDRNHFLLYYRVCGLMVRIDAFQALAPGSIPGKLKSFLMPPWPNG